VHSNRGFTNSPSTGRSSLNVFIGSPLLPGSRPGPHVKTGRAPVRVVDFLFVVGAIGKVARLVGGNPLCADIGTTVQVYKRLLFRTVTRLQTAHSQNKKSEKNPAQNPGLIGNQDNPANSNLVFPRAGDSPQNAGDQKANRRTLPVPIHP